LTGIVVNFEKNIRPKNAKDIDIRHTHCTPRQIIEPANRLHILWKKIVDNEVIKEGKDNRIWKLANGVQWLDDMDILYNREIYDKFLIGMKGKKLVLIKGSPGIGKSTFLERLLVEIVEEAHKEHKDIPSVVIAIREGQDVKKYWLNPDGTVEKFDIGIQMKDQNTTCQTVWMPTQFLGPYSTSKLHQAKS
jgi:ATPase subunit of ABC transporter with duplicated ATPase domains